MAHNRMSRAERPEAIQQLYHQRWRIWIAAILAYTIGMFHLAAMAPMADRLMADFSVSVLAFGSLGPTFQGPVMTALPGSFSSEPHLHQADLVKNRNFLYDCTLKGF